MLPEKEEDELECPSSSYPDTVSSDSRIYGPFAMKPARKITRGGAEFALKMGLLGPVDVPPSKDYP